MDNIKNNEPNYNEWLARDFWKPEEAACLLKRKNPLHSIQYYGSVPMIDDIEIQSMYKICNSWLGRSNLLGDLPYFYLEKAIIENIDIPAALINGIKTKFKKNSKFNPSLIQKYPNLAKKFKINHDEIKPLTPGNSTNSENDLSERKKNTYLKLIHALTLEIAGTPQNNSRYWYGNKINTNNIAKYICQRHTDENGNSIPGLGEQTIRKIIGDALDIPIKEEE